MPHYQESATNDGSRPGTPATTEDGEPASRSVPQAPFTLRADAVSGRNIPATAPGTFDLHDVFGRNMHTSEEYPGTVGTYTDGPSGESGPTRRVWGSDRRLDRSIWDSGQSSVPSPNRFSRPGFSPPTITSDIARRPRGPAVSLPTVPSGAPIAYSSSYDASARSNREAASSGYRVETYGPTRSQFVRFEVYYTTDNAQLDTTSERTHSVPILAPLMGDYGTFEAWFYPASVVPDEATDLWGLTRASDWSPPETHDPEQQIRIRNQVWERARAIWDSVHGTS
ncbi:hypothetical protein IAU59_002535 [Kwoniella sp. CBS 9459]